MSERFIRSEVLETLVSKSAAKVFRGIVSEYTTEEVMKAFVLGVVNGNITIKKEGN